MTHEKPRTPAASEVGATDVTTMRLRAPGHALSMSWSGEYGEESSSTGTCTCGLWEESGSSQAVVREEYRLHLRTVLGHRWLPVTRRWVR
ncbi:hypothetical protein ASF47_18450 [Nocardioides sp. Leaf285]|nr:hypothetical protein ASF47_18450 [Nocardioides sp. Leaf285]